MTVLLLGMQVEGCATTGHPPALTEPTVADRDAAEQFELTRVGAGSQILVTLRDGATVGGTYRDIGRTDDATYQRRFRDFSKARGDSLPPLPAPGSAIVVRPYHSNPRAAQLTGYGLRSIELMWNGEGDPRQVTFEDFESLTDSSGTVWTSRALSIEATRGRLPSNAQLEMNTKGGVQAFAVDEVAAVIARPSTGNWVPGFVVGLLVGAVVSALIIAEAERQAAVVVAP